MHCNHTGDMSVAQLSVARMSANGTNTEEAKDCCGMEPECHCCHKMKAMINEKPCMDYTLISSQPTTFSQYFNIDLCSPYTLVPDFMTSVAVLTLHRVNKGFIPVLNGNHAPPRSYLRLITKLLI